MGTIAALIALVAIVVAQGLIARELLRRRDRELERILHTAERERAQLLDRIMYMARQPWGEPPVLSEEEWISSEPDFSYPEVELLE